MQVFVEALSEQCGRHGLDAELILVEWNPPHDRPRLAEALRWPVSRRCKVRIIEVPSELHRRFDNGQIIPLHQMIAKNVGIRRARGNFVAATNIDVLFSDKLMEFLAGDNLETGLWYRADRYDVRENVPAGVSVEEQLAFCRDNLLRVHERDGTRDLKTGAFNRIYRAPNVLRAFRLLAPFKFLPFLGERLENARNSFRFIDECGRLHTNACGDFTLMAHQNWLDLRGYWEFAGFPFNVDGILCHAACFLGLNEKTLPSSSCVYHIEHGKGSGFTGYVSGKKWTELDTGGIPWITPEAYTEIVHEIISGKRPPVMNNDDWGLGGEELTEYGL